MPNSFNPNIPAPVGGSNFRTNSPLPNIDFAPKPIANPIDSLLSGVERGQSMGLRRQQVEAFQRERDLQERKLAQDKADKSISYLTDSKFSKFLSKETKLKLFKENVVPVLNSNYGLNIDPAAISHDGGEDGNIENLLNLIKNGASKDVIQHEYQQAVLKSDPEELPVLKAFGESIKPERPSVKAPPGYRFTSEGDLEIIPGGPADAKAQAEKTKADVALSSQKERANLVIGKVDNALGKVSNLTAGYGSKLSNVPGTDAKDLASTLDTIKANLGFDQLAEMKNQSKAGASGLGALSEQEMKLLISARTSLDQGQSPAQLSKNLGDVKTHLQNWLQMEQGINPYQGKGGGGGNTVTFRDSEGETHTIPAANLKAAQQRDPGLQVVQ